VEALEELTKKRKTATDGGCSDGEHCQRLASEDELPKLLAEGWHASLVLPSGKVVVERVEVKEADSFQAQQETSQSTEESQPTEKVAEGEEKQEA